MTDPHREAPPGLFTPSSKANTPFDHRGWVLWALIAGVAAGVVTGWRLDDWILGGAVAGGVYVAGLLTIIAWKD